MCPYDAVIDFFKYDDKRKKIPSCSFCPIYSFCHNKWILVTGNNAYHLSYEENYYHKNEHEHKEVSSQSEKHQVTRWKLMLQKRYSCQKKKIFVEEGRFHQQDSISYSRNKIPLSGLKSCVRNIISLAGEKSQEQNSCCMNNKKVLMKAEKSC